jgi:hypothetical protein
MFVYFKNYVLFCLVIRNALDVKNVAFRVAQAWGHDL